MLRAAAVGNTISKEEFKAAVPDLRQELIEAQYELRNNASFPCGLLLAFIRSETVALLTMLKATCSFSA